MGSYNNRVVPTSNNPVAIYSLEPHNPLKFMAHWDSLNYITIANSGYSSTDLANFFPLYPLLIHVLSYLTGSPLYAGVIISWLCLIGIIYFYMQIIGLLFKDDLNGRFKAAILLLLFPTAIFFLAVYTESLFAMLALGSIYFTLKKSYWLAGLLAAFMSATHITGLFVLALIGLIMIEDKVKLSRIILTLLTGSLGIIAYMFYLGEKFAQPFSFITAQKSHGWLASHYTNLLPSADLISLIFIILIIISAIYWWNKRRSLSIYGLLFLLIPIVGQQFGGFNRYVLMAFPIPLMLYGYSRHRPNLYIICVIGTSILWTYFLLQYSGGYIGG